MPGWIKIPLGTEVGLGADHIALDGDPAPPPKKGHSPHFLAHVCYGQMAWWIKIPLGTEVGLGPYHIVLDVGPAPPPKKGHSPLHFSAHVHCGQTAAWIKMPLGMKVSLVPGHIVLHGDPGPPTGAHPPIFGPCLLWQYGCLSQLLQCWALVLLCVEWAN